MQKEEMRPGLRVAVVGGGISGITSAYLLQNIHHVTLFEKNDYVGGHTHTISIPRGPDSGTPVDTGFIVLNDRTYPTLNRLFDRLGVAVRKSDMSFSYFCQKTGFQYASNNFNSLFAQRRNLLSSTYWAMLAEIMRFNRKVLERLEFGGLEDLTLGAYLRQHNHSDRFREQYLFPMVAAIWSAPDAEVDQFPMLTFARFFNNHGLLAVKGQPQWYFVAGGSHTYVQAFLKQFKGTVLSRTAIKSIQRGPAGVTLTQADGHRHTFDRVVIATHANQAYALLADPTEDETRLLSPWRYSTNQTYLHTDIRWMPVNRRAWASWNFIRETGADAQTPVSLTYHMNRLQRLDTHAQYLVTLNPFATIDEKHIIARMTYTHPTFTFDSLNTQADLSRLNGAGNILFCGSYFGYGFHEDGARAGAQVAAALGASHEF